jgi:hypothetical protein
MLPNGQFRPNLIQIHPLSKSKVNYQEFDSLIDIALSSSSPKLSPNKNESFHPMIRTSTSLPAELKIENATELFGAVPEMTQYSTLVSHLKILFNKSKTLSNIWFNKSKKIY